MSESRLTRQLLPLRLPPPPCFFQPRGLPHPPFFSFFCVRLPFSRFAAVSFPTFPSALQPSSPKAACPLQDPHQSGRSVQSRPHGPQHAGLPAHRPLPEFTQTCPSGRRCHPAASPSAVPFCSRPQALPASGSFPRVGSSHPVAKVLELQLQHQPSHLQVLFHISPSFLATSPVKAGTFSSGFGVTLRTKEGLKEASWVHRDP